MTNTATEPASASAEQAVLALAKELQALGRDDLLVRANAARARLVRPTSIICVVGEFKQGKSSLVNGLLGADVCPVDDDLATSAITLVSYGEQPSATVFRHDGASETTDQVPVEGLRDWVCEEGNPGNAKGVERVQVSYPATVLSNGLSIVDTPGVGGLGAGHAATTLAFLPFADGLVLASDASSELSEAEVELLVKARELCPTVLFVQTKIDLYHSWRRIFEINQGHLQRAGLQIPSVAVSSHLRATALARGDRDINDASGFPQLLGALDGEVIQPAKAHVNERAWTDVASMTELVSAGLTEERRVLADPSQAEATAAQLQEAREHLASLRGPGGRWQVTLNDGLSDLGSSINYQFRSGMREVIQAIDERIEVLHKGTEWDELIHDMQSAVAEQVSDAIVAIERGRDHVASEIAESIAEEGLELPGDMAHFDVTDVAQFWRAKDIRKGGPAGPAGGTAIATLRGASSGVGMVSSLGKFVGLTAGAVMVINPVTIAMGAVFGGVGILDDRNRRVAARRNAARQAAHAFTDDVSFQISEEISSNLRQISRELRDHFTERLGELLRTYTEAEQTATATLQRSDGENKARLAEIDSHLELLGRIQHAADDAIRAAG
jgi:Dynamin family